MTHKKIVVLAGDGIGPEVTKCAREVLEVIGTISGQKFEFEDALIGHSAIEATGEPLPQATLDKCQQADAILLGAVGHPMYDNNPGAKVRPEQGLLKLRKSLELFANIRPIKLFDELLHSSSIKPEILQGVDILFFRELTSGIYFGTPRERSADGNSAIDTLAYTKEEVRRIAIKAFKAASQRNKKVCSVDKANVLETSRLWREVVTEVAKDYPEVTFTHMFVDNASMQLIRDPRQFDVVLTGNMFGDILTDEASQIAGSMGMLASASMGEQTSVYEPIHGSAPDIAGKGIANPLAAILSVALMLDLSLGMPNEARQVEQAIADVLRQGYRTVDIAEEGLTPEKQLNTEQMSEKVKEVLLKNKSVVSSQ
ncbi:3-isopropylmalate dehydrogenase [uncultured Microscilla sp.]|uniref:3-isopropylmalate dehydrogenase n=1 Tax=uncultured Microscilla sp. TaxID=432653 RepID=UPI002633587A|nr:3-isopropylmalate dehydrogenase [uncultured Microscilla sp.]